MLAQLLRLKLVHIGGKFGHGLGFFHTQKLLDIAAAFLVEIQNQNPCAGLFKKGKRRIDSEDSLIRGEAILVSNLLKIKGVLDSSVGAGAGFMDLGRHKYQELRL